MNETPQSPKQRLIQHLRTRGIHSERVLAAMASVPRDQFVPAELHDRAWDDDALPIAHGQTISQPMIVAWMTELLALQGGEHVLEIGTGTGYQTAVLAALAGDVVTIERIGELSRSAAARLQRFGVLNVKFIVGDGSLGWPDGAPYDAIMVTAGAPDIPAPLYNQLKMGGRMVLPVGDAWGQEMELVHKTERGPEIKRLGGCRFVPLIGDAGWESQERRTGHAGDRG